MHQRSESMAVTSPSETWQVYMVSCADDTLYTGIAKNLSARIARHNAGDGAKYTRSRRPVRLVYQEPAPSRGAAQQREHALRRLPAHQKRALIAAARRQVRA